MMFASCILTCLLLWCGMNTVHGFLMRRWRNLKYTYSGIMCISFKTWSRIGLLDHLLICCTLCRSPTTFNWMLLKQVSTYASTNTTSSTTPIRQTIMVSISVKRISVSILTVVFFFFSLYHIISPKTSIHYVFAIYHLPTRGILDQIWCSSKCPLPVIHITDHMKHPHACWHILLDI